MSRLHHAELRRLVSYLRAQVNDADRLIEIEGELQGEEAEEFLREPALLAYFPALTEVATVAGAQWRIRVIPHAHLRMVQRGIKMETVLSLFARFVEQCVVEGQEISARPYTIYERSSGIVLRVDVDTVEAAGGKAHVVTVFIGRSEAAEAIEV